MVDGRVEWARWEEVKSGFAVRWDEAGAGGVVVVVVVVAASGCWKVGLDEVRARA